MDEPPRIPPGIPWSWRADDGERYPYRYSWIYRDAAGAVIGHVARFESPVNGKHVIPFFKRTRDGFAFRAGAAPEPRPLYGLDTLDRPGPLFAVEGEKAATALHRLGLAAVSAPGGARAAAKADWRPAFASVTDDRPLVIWPDHDDPGHTYAADVHRLADGAAVRVVTAPPEGTPDEPGADAADWLGAALTAEGPAWDRLGELPEGADIESLRALLLGALAPVLGKLPAEWRPAKPEPRELEEPQGEPVPYVVTDQGIVAIGRRNGVLTETLLANFAARISEELLLDDGVATNLSLAICGTCGGRTMPTARVSAAEFQAMTWPVRQWGTHCMVSPGVATRDRLRHAVQWLSHRDGSVPRRTVYRHTGWRRAGDSWMYLSAGGALGAAGLVAGIEVELDELTMYALPAPSQTPAERLEAARASLNLLCVAPDHVSIPLAAVTYLAPSAQALRIDMTLWAEGPKEAGKSSICGAWCAHFGHGIDRLHLAASWHDTPNAIETKLFTLADTLAVVDDYAPQPSPAAQHEMDRVVSRVVRGIGNRSGRGRLGADLALKPERRPRALVVATAEQWPTGESICARLFGVEMRPGDLALDRLTVAQRDAADGLLARSMSDYLRDMAAAHDGQIRAAAERWRELRGKALSAGLTGRLPEQIGYLALGYELGLGHWARCGALSEDDRADMAAAAWATLLDLAHQHAARVRTTQPAAAFRAALVEMLAAGACHLADRTNGGRPPDGSRYGWNGDMPHGARIGWVDVSRAEAYLLATPALEAVSEALRRSGQPLSLRPAALWRQSRERGYLLPGDEGDAQRSTRAVKILGQRERVLVFDLKCLAIGE
jgi:hypothetical protein